MKPRVMSLVVFTAAIGLLIAPVAMGPLRALVSILCIAIGGGASGALNMRWDADVDALMRRTARRPVPAGRVAPETARNLGLLLSALSVSLLALVANVAAAALLAFTIFFYAVVYTMWLKRSTPLNIVIGGAAGAFPSAIGWIAATGGLGIEPLLMFGLIFMWTPPHFWALALFMGDDYSRAGIPMLTVTHGHRETRRRILAYTLLLAPLGPALAFSAIGGPFYLALTLALNAAFLKRAWGLWQRDEATAEADAYSAEKQFFHLSLYYIFAHFAGLLIEAALRWSEIGWKAWPVLL